MPKLLVLTPWPGFEPWSLHIVWVSNDLSFLLSTIKNKPTPTNHKHLFSQLSFISFITIQNQTIVRCLKCTFSGIKTLKKLINITWKTNELFHPYMQGKSGSCMMQNKMYCLKFKPCILRPQFINVSNILFQFKWVHIKLMKFSISHKF
jgi:hypothetical protein